jgi:phosphate transport system substrate-binding protein
MSKKAINAVNLLVAMVLLVSLSACGAPTQTNSNSSLKGTISVSGAFALYPMMQKWAEEFQKINPEVNFDISAGGAGKGMADALSGAVDIGMISRDITKDEEAKGAFWVAVTKDAVFMVVNEKNPVLQDLLAHGVQQKTYVGIYITGEVKTWGQVVNRPEITDDIHVFTRSDSSGAADTWAKYLGKKQEDLMGIGVMGDPGLLDAIVKDPLGIGYNNLNYAFDPSTGKFTQGTVVIPIDKNGNGAADADEKIASKTAAVDRVLSGMYPSPPARLLYLATRGKPNPLAQAFMVWILQDGQKYLTETGYIPLTPDQQQASLTKVQ